MVSSDYKHLFMTYVEMKTLYHKYLGVSHQLLDRILGIVARASKYLHKLIKNIYKITQLKRRLAQSCAILTCTASAAALLATSEAIALAIEAI